MKLFCVMTAVMILFSVSCPLYYEAVLCHVRFVMKLFSVLCQFCYEAVFYFMSALL